MLRQLYLRGPDGIRYWEAWDAEEAVVLHLGRLGDIGEVQRLALKPGQQAKDVIAGEFAKVRAQGYKLLRPPRKSNFVVRFGVEGVTRERYQRKTDRLWELVSRVLHGTANGYCLADAISDDEK